ncbi:MAG TPA: hypothetical protein PK125_02120 [Syntrophorhabdus sp.]|jgi:hypothetical protein|nr:hypothetical protein [Syntrophorhabdus sp.]HPW35238.1 hypothetical protein [Syntrophorhabdus sp.]HQB33296.1 hypothetical protein [Syntrophorhabdus sp.]HQP55737.1 hypothetical protein [Syntrophorhabdus sp.]
MIQRFFAGIILSSELLLKIPLADWVDFVYGQYVDVNRKEIQVVRVL